MFESESSSSEDNLDFEEIAENNERAARTRDFIESVVENCNNKEFQQHFRISRVHFQELLNSLSPSLERQAGSCGRKRIPANKQLLSVLWLLATPDSYRSIGCRFNLSKSSLFTCFYQVITSLNEKAPQVINWPNNVEKYVIKQSFQDIAGLRGVIGAVDGTYVPIKAPHDNPDIYINRKCFHAITLQAICTPDLKFIDCFTGYPSSVSDIRIFRNSDIFAKINNNRQHFLEDNEHILGDKAYPLSNWCITPYIDRGHLTQRQRRFNTVHAKTRQVIERAFALLFGRFRRLRLLDMNRTDLIPSTIIAACTLHNLCLLGDNDMVEDFIAEGVQQRNEEINAEQRLENDGGNAKRDYLATLI